jgi:rubrerythrin
MQLEEAISVAIQYEHRVRDHYAECARKTEDAKGKRVFATMAREEQGHVEYLEARMAEWKSSGAVAVAELPTVLPSLAWIQAETLRLAGRPAATVDPGQPELGFLKEALELEHKTSTFYRSLVEQLDPGYRGMFARFLEIEDGHVAIVQAEIDALAGHGHWFDFMEFSLEGE